MSNRNPTEHEVFRLLKEELSSLAAEVFLPFRWRLTTKKKDRKKNSRRRNERINSRNRQPKYNPPSGPSRESVYPPAFSEAKPNDTGVLLLIPSIELVAGAHNHSKLPLPLL